uniref:EF-hand domain-containing protein n=1 Tax=Pinctada fucata TaxID=50426 RepID=A0A194APU4_PINFU
MFAKTLVVLLSLASALGAPTTTQSTGHSALDNFKALVRKQITALWARVDTDHDGHFEKNDMHHILDDYDDDKNGQVSNAEFVHHFAASNPDLNVIAKGLFLEFDMDHDGEITYTDLDLYYQKIDTNDNGHVEESEFVHYFTEIFTILFVIQLNQQATTTAIVHPAAVGK